MKLFNSQMEQMTQQLQEKMERLLSKSQMKSSMVQTPSSRVGQKIVWDDHQNSAFQVPDASRLVNRSHGEKSVRLMPN